MFTRVCSLEYVRQNYVRQSANNRPRLQAPLIFHDGVLIDSGRIIYRSGLNPGGLPRKVTDTARPDARENGTLPQVK